MDKRMKKDMLELYKGFCDYTIEKTGRFEKDHANAIILRKEVNDCIKKRKPLSSYWRLMAYDLFKRNKIVDERITDDNILRSVEFEHEGRKHVTDVRYLNFDMDKFPEQSICTQNQERENEKDYIIRILKRSIGRYKNCDTSKVYVFQNYVLILADNNAKEDE